MIRAAAIVIVAIVLLTCVAVAQHYPMVPFTNRPLATSPGFLGSPMVPNGGGPMVPNGDGGSTPPPAGCSGAADFSDGCAIAVFGH